MTDAARARRLADRIREVAAEVIERQVKDPRLGFVTVTDARLTPDLREATVFYTVYGDETARTDTAAALAKATGLVRSAVGRATGVKHTPSVVFVLDAVPDQAGRIDELLAAAREADRAVHAVAEGATPAGDPDPYRVPRAEDPDDDEEPVGPDAVEPGLRR